MGRIVRTSVIVPPLVVAVLASATFAVAQGTQPEDQFAEDADLAPSELLRREQADLRDNRRTGDMIFIHPDGTGPNTFGAGRIYWEGPDAASAWDRLPEMAVYRGHQADILTGTSNGGATTHAFGYKVQGLGSFGQDGNSQDDPPTNRSILGLSDYPGSVMREAANAGKPVGIVNDGDVAEPGTGAFLAEVGNRNDANEINRQIIQGRPGFDDADADPYVVLGGGEANYFPQGTPVCTGEPQPDCVVHTPAEAPVAATGGARTDGLNLVQQAIDEGFEVVRTRAEFEAPRERLASDRRYAPRVLGLFADEDVFNDAPEEELIAAGLVDPSIPAADERSNLILWGTPAGRPGYDPPRAEEMSEVAIDILDRVARKQDQNFLLVTEVESTDNFGNENNAIGTLTGVRDAFGVIAAAQAHVAERPRSTVLTAADSDGGGLQIIGNAPEGAAPATVGSASSNPTGEDAEDVLVPLDGLYGRDTQPFVAAADQFGQELPFAVTWSSTADVSGGIVSRAEGRNAKLLRTSFSERFDDIDVYRMMYLSVCGEALDYPTGERAPDRP